MSMESSHGRFGAKRSRPSSNYLANRQYLLHLVPLRIAVKIKIMALKVLSKLQNTAYTSWITSINMKIIWKYGNIHTKQCWRTQSIKWYIVCVMTTIVSLGYCHSSPLSAKDHTQSDPCDHGPFTSGTPFAREIKCPGRAAKGGRPWPWPPQLIPSQASLAPIVPPAFLFFGSGACVRPRGLHVLCVSAWNTVFLMFPG